jgi:hypothetical protein
MQNHLSGVHYTDHFEDTLSVSLQEVPLCVPETTWFQQSLSEQVELA